jgi:hypothetical protein
MRPQCVSRPRRLVAVPSSSAVLPPLALLASLAVLVLAGCQGAPPPDPPADAVTWRAFHNDAVGYSVELPTVFERTGERGQSVLFRYQGYPVLCINYVDEAEGRRRGLWVGKEDSGPARLGGRDGRRFVYRHYDGPFSMRTVSYVVGYRGKLLGLEFRTDLAEPDSLQRRILDSFRLD